MIYQIGNTGQLKVKWRSLIIIVLTNLLEINHGNKSVDHIKQDSYH